MPAHRDAFAPAELSRRLIAVEEALQLTAAGSTRAAVLVPLYVEGGELHAVFTKRSA